MHRFFRWTAMLVVVFTFTVNLTLTSPAAQNGRYVAHALVLQTDASGVTTVANYRLVTQEAPLVSMDSGRFSAVVAEATTPSRVDDDHAHESEPVILQLLDDASGAIRYQTVVNVPSAIRGEFHFDIENPTRFGFNGSNIVRHDVELQTRTFPVRLPVIAGASTVNVQPLTGARIASRIDLRTVGNVVPRASDIDPVHDIAPTLYTLDGYGLGPVDNRVDILIMGDGYTQSQLNKFRTDAKVFADGMFAITPYKTYRAFFNVQAVYAPSKQSGADRPPFNAACNDFDNSDGISCCRDNNPSWTAQTRSTRYNSTFCWSQIARLMVAGDADKVFADADAAYPDWDEIWIITNDTTYGGSGGELAAASLHPLGVQIQQHEVGHSLMKLADEYGGSSTTLFCNDKNVETSDDCPFNITNVTTRAALKWNYWVSSSTPIPSSGPLADAAGAGLWRGAGYSDSAGYRNCFDCIMRTLGRPFGKVSAEQLPIRLYQGGWEGAFVDFLPAEGVSMVDNFTPSNDSAWNIPAGGSLDLSAAVVGPTGKKIEVVWLLNGTPIKTEKVNPNTLVRYTFTPLTSLDDAVVTLQVTDIHATLHPTNRILSRSEVTWMVDAVGAPNTPVALLSNGGFETAASSGENRAEGWTHKNIKGARKCGDSLANTGNCYYQLQGISGKVGTLKQVAVAGVEPYADARDLLTLSGRFNSTNLTGTFEVVATLVWSDGTKTKVILPKLTQTSGGYALAETRYQVLAGETRTANSFDVTLRFKTAGGKVLVDELALMIYPDFIAAR